MEKTKNIQSIHVAGLMYKLIKRSKQNYDLSVDFHRCAENGQ